jgi:hypothetical protein
MTVTVCAPHQPETMSVWTLQRALAVTAYEPGEFHPWEAQAEGSQAVLSPSPQANWCSIPCPSLQPAPLQQ